MRIGPYLVKDASKLYTRVILSNDWRHVMKEYEYFVWQVNNGKPVDMAIGKREPLPEGVGVFFVKDGHRHLPDKLIEYERRIYMTTIDNFDYTPEEVKP